MFAWFHRLFYRHRVADFLVDRVGVVYPSITEVRLRAKRR